MSLSKVRVISLDVTGTLIRHRDPIMETYAQAMVWSRFPKPVSAEKLAPAFKSAYKRALLDCPYFGKNRGLSSKQWWIRCVQNVLKNVDLELGADYSQADFDRFFRRVYQHYGCPEGYTPMDDAKPFLKWATQEGYLLGVTTNTPSRTMDSVLPFMGLHQYLRFFCCSQDCGSEKPEKRIFDYSFSHIAEIAKDIVANDMIDEVIPYDEARNINYSEDGVVANDETSVFPMINTYQRLKVGHGDAKNIDPSEILHIGDSLAADLCGPMQFGWQGMYLDRSGDPNVRVYQDWLEAPDYPGKSEEDIRMRTVTSFAEVRALLENGDI